MGKAVVSTSIGCEGLDAVDGRNLLIANDPDSMAQAVLQIVLADLSMSLDNVLAVAGIARDHAWVLVFGLVLSVALMGAAATLIANLLRRWPWLVYIGLAIILYVACHMIYDGTLKVYDAAQLAGTF